MARKRAQRLAEQLADATRTAEQRTRELAAKTAECERLAAQHDALQSLVSVRAERIRALEAELASTNPDPPAEQAELRAAQQQAQEAAQRRAAEQLEQLRTEHARQMETLRSTMTQREAAFERTLAALEVEHQRLRAPPPSSSDDLQAIRGIGPAYARRLANAGVHTYRQIAGWTAADVRAAAQRMGVAATRIERWDWVGAAKRLLADTATGERGD